MANKKICEWRSSKTLKCADVAKYTVLVEDKARIYCSKHMEFMVQGESQKLYLGSPSWVTLRLRPTWYEDGAK